MRALRLSFAVLMSASSTLLAADFYVSTSGNDSNNGSIGSPFATFGRGFTAAQAGDTIFARGGTYTQRITVSKSGTVSAPIILRAYPGETPVIDLNGQSVPPGQGDQAIITITNRSHIVVQGFTLQNWRADTEQSLPEGILISANNANSVSNVRLLSNTIHHIEQNDPTLGNFSANAHGIKVAGRSTNAMTGIVIDGNHLHNLRLGASEALVINGNVTDFRITHNRVHDCNNIGIDMIGFEGSLPTTIDRARNGVCSENTVYNIDARFNPAYDGDFVLGGGSPSAGGIYVDGGTNIIIERNVVYSCNYGIEIASEEDFGVGITDFITVRNNVISFNHQAGLIMGGFNASRGTTANCSFLNNTFYTSGTLLADEQITFQHHVENNTFRNNIIVANSGRAVIACFGSATSTFTGNVFSHNLYFSASGGPQFVFNGNKALTAWQGNAASGGDTGSTAEDPLFEDVSLTINTPVRGFKPRTTSPAINTGQPSPPYQPGSDEKDLEGHSRRRGGRVDRGAFER